MDAKETLLEELRRHALIIGEVTLSGGASAQYYVDVKRAILRPAGFRALAELVATHARRWNASAVGGLTMGADAPACAALAGGAEVKASSCARRPRPTACSGASRARRWSPAPAAWSWRTW
jgi:orotate phosphoribosyltransferase